MKRLGLLFGIMLISTLTVGVSVCMGVLVHYGIDTQDYCCSAMSAALGVVGIHQGVGLIHLWCKHYA